MHKNSPSGWYGILNLHCQHILVPIWYKLKAVSSFVVLYDYTTLCLVWLYNALVFNLIALLPYDLWGIYCIFTLYCIVNYITLHILNIGFRSVLSCFSYFRLCDAHYHIITIYWWINNIYINMEDRRLKIFRCRKLYYICWWGDLDTLHCILIVRLENKNSNYNFVWEKETFIQDDLLVTLYLLIPLWKKTIFY